MKRAIYLFFVASVMTLSGIAQDSLPERAKILNISDRPKDHFVLQLGAINWLQKPDSFATKGLSRSISVYVMYDLAFKTDPRFSIGAGVGVGSDHVFFDKDARRDLVINNIRGVQFNKLTGADTANSYKSIKLHTAYLEVPLEFRFMSKPEQPNKSFKVAVGMKIGTLIAAVDKTRFQRDGAGNGPYNLKIKDRSNFNNLRLAATARMGYGNFGAYVQYQLNDFIKEGRGPNDIRPLQIGITISGL